MRRNLVFKSILTLLLAFCLLLTLTACQSAPADEPAKETAGQAEEPSAQEEEAAIVETTEEQAEPEEADTAEAVAVEEEIAPTDEPAKEEKTGAEDAGLDQLLLKLFGKTEGLDPFVVEALSVSAHPLDDAEMELAIRCFKEDGCETGRGDMTIAFANGYGDNVWLQEVIMNFVLQAIAYPEVSDIIITQSHGDQAKALSDLRTLVVQEPDVLVSLQTVAEAAKPVYRELIEGGITVVSLNSPTGGVQGEDYSGEVLQAWLGTEIGELITEQLGGQGTVALILGPAGFPPEQQCVGEMTAVMERYEDIEILPAINTDWTQETVFQATTSLLSRYPEIDAIYQSFGEAQRGAIRAYHQADRPLDILSIHHNVSNGFIGDWVNEDNQNWRVFTSSGGQITSRIALHMGMKLNAGEEAPTSLMDPSTFFQVKSDDYDPTLSDSLNPYSAVPTDLYKIMFAE
ncbi:MAG: substrate-binding domain-containing protein [Anaerolineales bacterium]|nr:substrate-binding domain-containing protein [Anaerolineales bacterium]